MVTVWLASCTIWYLVWYLGNINEYKFSNSIKPTTVGLVIETLIHPDNSVNNRVGSILTWGEMLHNNHKHWRATSNSHHWSEIDMSGWVIKGLKNNVILFNIFTQ